MAVEGIEEASLRRSESRLGTPAARRRWLSFAQLVPAAIYLAVFLVVPLGVFFVYSFWVTRTYEIVPEWSLAQYTLATTDAVYRALFWNTIVIAFVAGLVTVVLAYALAHVMRWHLRHRQDLLLFGVVIALFSGYLVRIYAWRTILGNEGIVNQALMALGLIDQPLSFLLFSRPAAIIVLVNFLVPLAVLPIYSALQNVGDEEVEAARDLGAGAFTAFRKITLPLAWSGVFSAFAISFIIAAGDYVTPQLVGGTSGAMIGRAIANTFGVTFDWPRGSALSFVTLGLVLGILGVVRAVGDRILR